MKIRRLTAMLTVAVMLLTGVTAAGASSREELVAQISTDAGAIISSAGRIITNVYSNLKQVDAVDTLPARFDLRDRGVVPPVRSQGSFGTCWSFASVAASEISILSDLGMSAQEFEEREGMSIDLSPRHLAWFSTVPIQAEEDMRDVDAAQVGEGRVLYNDDGSAGAHLSTGGFMGYASSMFAAGIGPVPEKLVPYTANDGSDSTAADWSVDESLHFVCLWQLKDAHILPSPAGCDADGNYVYVETATQMMKQELLSGRGVSIIYHSDRAMDPQARFNQYRDDLIAKGIPEESAVLYALFMVDEIDVDTLTDEQLRELYKVEYSVQKHIPYDEVTEEMVQAYMNPQEPEEEEAEATDTEETEAEETDTEAAADEQQSQKQALIELMGFDLKKVQERNEKRNELKDVSFMNTDTYAQYVWSEALNVDHAVVIVGYDDNYSASNFLAEHQPPADGAWIVRNSWGSDYGNDGYFYLSYYDRSISHPESFAFVTDDDSLGASGLEIDEYDFMPAASVNTAAVHEPVYLANEFTIEADSVLSYVSAMTANYDTNVTVAVYLLDEDAAAPNDGKLLDVVTANYKYAGYHRIPLNMHYRLNAGTRIGVVQTQRFYNDDGMYYAVPYTLAQNSEYTQVMNNTFGDSKTDCIEGRIGHHTSYICVDDQWTEWIDFIDEVRAASARVERFVAFDNLSVKTYLYHLPDVLEAHTFGDPIPYGSGTVRLCTDCGYSLVEN